MHFAIYLSYIISGENAPKAIRTCVEPIVHSAIPPLLDYEEVVDEPARNQGHVRVEING